MDQECVREDIYVEGRRYRRFVYPNSKTVFDHTQETLTGGRVSAAPIRETKKKKHGQKAEKGNQRKLEDKDVVSEKGVLRTTFEHFPIVLRKKVEDLDLSSSKFVFNGGSDGECTLLVSSTRRDELEFACEKVHAVLSDARDSYTHFQAVPLHAAAQEERNKFEVSEDAGQQWKVVNKVSTQLVETGIARQSSFIGQHKLHLTLFLVSILSEAELKRTQEALQRIGPVVYDAVGGTSIPLTVGKLGWFGTSANAAKVLYMHVSESGKPGQPTTASQIPAGHAGVQKCPRLARVVGILARSLQEIGVLSTNQHKKQGLGEDGVNCSLNWHMTLFNTKYDQGKAFGLSSVDLAQFTDQCELRAPCIGLYSLSATSNNSRKRTAEKGMYTLNAVLPLP